MLSLILGAGAVVTGFFGMNFGGYFAKVFFDAQKPFHLPHALAVGGVALFAMGSILFGIYVVVSNWTDYRDSLLPRWWRLRRQSGSRSLRRSS